MKVQAESIRRSDQDPAPKRALLLTIPEVAAALRISRSSVYRLFDGGQLGWVRVGGTRRVTPAEIDRFITEHTEKAAS
ncbi:MAG TPA: helix-turn-helix domain-containing protein [Mycobacterium sp.]|nr:helix-turn-helix domain-containing protein [Mycobacterium sp.]HUH69074.1 helix-turn-helix domain-containing protein [Mycobacterium sp.]